MASGMPKHRVKAKLGVAEMRVGIEVRPSEERRAFNDRL